jgi:ATP-dependent Clp protease ATP-binding subunit ClpX
LVRILTEPKNSLVRQFQHLLRMDNVTLEFEPTAFDAVATEAFLRRTGARGLRSIVEAALLDVMYEVPGRTDVARCVVTKEVFTQGKPPLLLNHQGQPVNWEREYRPAA